MFGLLFIDWSSNINMGIYKDIIIIIINIFFKIVKNFLVFL